MVECANARRALDQIQRELRPLPAATPLHQQIVQQPDFVVVITGFGPGRREHDPTGRAESARREIPVGRAVWVSTSSNTVSGFLLTPQCS